MNGPDRSMHLFNLIDQSRVMMVCFREMGMLDLRPWSAKACVTAEMGRGQASIGVAASKVTAEKDANPAENAPVAGIQWHTQSTTASVLSTHSDVR